MIPLQQKASPTLTNEGTIERSAALFNRACKVMPSGYTRHMIVTKPHPQYATHGDGCWIVNVDGNRRLDWSNNFASLIHGHNKKEIVDTVAAQASRLMSAVLPTEWEVLLAELLAERIPSVERVRFTNSGTEANLIAIKAGRAYSGRSKVAKLEGGYHGQYDLLEASFQALPSQWGPADRPTPVAHNSGTPQSLLDELVLLPLNEIETSRDILRTNAAEIGTVILDPYGLSLGSMVEAEPGFVKMLREETQRLGMVLIFDEIWSLRLGYQGTQGEIGVTPDITTMGKIIGGGLPIGAVGGSAEVMSVFEVEAGEPKVKQSGTFTANPMSMAAGYVAMSLLTRPAVVALAERGERLRDGFARVLRDLRIPSRTSNRGSVTGFITTDRPIRNYRELQGVLAAGQAETNQALQKLLLQEGVTILRAAFVGSTAMTNDDVDFTIYAVEAALRGLFQI